MDIARLAAVLTLSRRRGDSAALLAAALRIARGEQSAPTSRASQKQRERAEQATDDRGVRLTRVLTTAPLPDELAWCVVEPPAGPDLRRTVAVVNSRKPRMPDGTAPWARTTVDVVRAQSQTGCVLASLEPLPYALAAAAAAGPILVHPQGVPSLLDGAAAGRWQSLTDGWPHLETCGWITPLACWFAASGAEAQRLRDRFIVQGAGQVIAVAVREGGGMIELLKTRLAAHSDADADAVSVTVSVIEADAVRSAGVDVRGNERLLALGARQEVAARSGSPAHDSASCNENEAEAHEPFNGGGRSSGKNSTPFLTHHTADQDGPWPGETRGAMLADLVRGGPESRRDAFQTLVRIARQGRVRAMTGGIRQVDRSRVHAVCFSELPPQAGHPLHHYDAARHRWLFGPYAVCIARHAAEALGARPVLYLPDEAWKGLGDNERFRFQLHQPPQVDRTREREWRIPADVDLRRLEPRDVLFVTRTAAEAAIIRKIGPWRARAVDATPIA